MQDLEGAESMGGGESDYAPDLRELLSHPHVVEVLDALSRGPMTVARISAHVPAGRRGLEAALRIVAAHGLVAKEGNGSWDTDAPGNTVYRHTGRGRRVVDALSRFSAWTTMFDGSTT
jgi:DNA-binding transcriptional ArsR family regulator